jgi:hypothetical protein
LVEHISTKSPSLPLGGSEAFSVAGELLGEVVANQIEARGHLSKLALVVSTTATLLKQNCAYTASRGKLITHDGSGDVFRDDCAKKTTRLGHLFLVKTED